MLTFPTAHGWDSPTGLLSVLLSAKKLCSGCVSHAILCGKIVQTLNCILDEAAPSFGQNGLVCQLLLSNAVSSDTLPSSANWEGFPHGFDLQHPICFSAPSRCNPRSPQLDLKNFLRGVSVGEAQLHGGGSSPRCKAQASSPCASFGPATMLGWGSAPQGQSGVGTRVGWELQIS